MVAGKTNEMKTGRERVRVMMYTTGEGVSRSVEVNMKSCVQSTEIVYMHLRPE